uniref:bifunctional serine/threonine-protein kinase/ABC transporter substrate-binding protein n=1 Tax=Gordonia sp. B7-2 TaxID=3420932 RepID=UPI003D9301EB
MAITVRADGCDVSSIRIVMPSGGPVILETGRIFAGYRVVRPIGQGGMGQVYLVEHPHLGRLEALKLIAVDHGDPQFEERFTREARTAAALKHPGIVTIYHYGVEQGMPWFTMDYVDGTDLASTQRLTRDEVGVVVSHSADALDYAHRHGVVHRDVKPANIMVTRDDATGSLERVVLLDFGIARLMSGARLTATSAFIGTFRYAAPEVLDGTSATDRADQYSLASTTFELLTGRAPFTAEHPAGLIAAQLSKPPMSPSEVSPELAPIDPCVQRALARNPAARYASCSDFARDFAAGLQVMNPSASVTATQVVVPPSGRGDDSNPAAVPTSMRASRAASVAGMGCGPGGASGPGSTPGEPLGPFGPPSGPGPHPSWPSQPPPPPRKKRRKALWAGGIAAMIVAALVVAAGVYGFRSDDESEVEAKASRAVGPGVFMPITQVAVDGSPAAHDVSQALDPRGSGDAKCAPTTIAWAGPLSGKRATRAAGTRNGVALAVQAHNDANPDCPVTVREVDTQGDPEQAARLTPGIIGDPSVIGVIGPWTSGEAFGMGPAFNAAGLAFASGSTTSPKLGTDGWRTFFRGTISDDELGFAIANYLAKTRRFSKVCVVGDDTDLSGSLSPSVAANLGSALAADCNLTLKAGSTDYAQQVARIKAVAPDAVFYGGNYPEAAPLVRQMRDAGVSATFVGGSDGIFNPLFVEAAGPAAKGTLVACNCGPSSEQFLAAYRDKFQAEPLVFASEAYDLTTIMLAGISSGVNTREAMVAHLQRYAGMGMAREYQWGTNGNLTFPRAWVFQVA